MTSNMQDDRVYKPIAWCEHVCPMNSRATRSHVGEVYVPPPKPHFRYSASLQPQGSFQPSRPSLQEQKQGRHGISLMAAFPSLAPLSTTLLAITLILSLL
mmetsp:Transcript_19652/g.49074  ORF Transcript_19652/g.49074 Transcript_19652/m.49074 type:complete len:100 (+) Transcript_19652:229-528(+)